MDRAEAIAFFERKKVALEKSEYILLGRNAYDAFCSAVDALREQEGRKWISVSERLPEDKELVLVTAKNCNPFTCWYNAPFRKWACSGWIEITHWMPLPEPPEEQK